MKMLVLVAGLPGSGKTTLARTLAEILGARKVDIDDFKRGLTRTDGIDPPEMRWKYYEPALNYIFRLFEEGASHAVVDEMFHVAELRQRIEAACAARGIEVRWIEVQCTDEEVRRRLEEHPRAGHILTTEEVLKIRAEVDEIFDGFCGDNHLAVTNLGEAQAMARDALRWVSVQ